MFGAAAFGRYVPPLTFVQVKHLPCDIDIALCLDRFDIAARIQFDQLATATSCPVHLPINNKASDATRSSTDQVVDLTTMELLSPRKLHHMSDSLVSVLADHSFPRNCVLLT